MTSSPSPISVLIRTFNSARTLDRVLSALKLQPGEEYIVVDSGSTDSTLSIAAAHHARIIHAEGPFNYSKSLNLGFRAARHPWVLVISSHSLPLVPDLMAALRSAAQDFPDNVVVGYGPNTINGGNMFQDGKVHYFNEEEIQVIYQVCTNGNTLYRRSAWEALPFDEGIRTGEDRDWLTKILAKGLNAAYISGALTINRNQYSLRYMFMKGYSDRRSMPYKPHSLLDLALGIGSLIKRFLRGGMPTGNLIRCIAQVFGQYFGSHQPQDNTPGNRLS
jgi:glycosyltransferase involved in cell wall biosynthesis